MLELILFGMLLLTALNQGTAWYWWMFFIHTTIIIIEVIINYLANKIDEQEKEN